MSYYPMDREEYRAALKRLDLTQDQAGWLFGGKSDRTGRRWATLGAPYAVAVIIAFMDEFELTKEHLEALGARWRKRISV
jgi:hypothetical protein